VRIEITGETIKYGGNELLKHISTLIHKIWMEKKMSEEWSIAVIYPIHEKVSKMDCDNYRGCFAECSVQSNGCPCCK
jgi:hypothetical protein